MGNYGIYVDVKPTNDKTKDNHRLYAARCSVCGTTVKRRKYDLQHKNVECHHIINPENISDARLRYIFRGMKRRCYDEENQDYNTYGGKGVKICDEWLTSPETFESWSYENGYQDTLTIDRIESDKDYSPDNCRWVTLSDNAKYKSTTKITEARGVEHTGREWSEVCGLGTNTINTYLRTYPEELVHDFIEVCMADGAPKRIPGKSYMDSYLQSLHKASEE